MARIYRVSGYFVDVWDESSKEIITKGLQGCAMYSNCLLRQPHIEESNAFSLEKNSPIYDKNCDMAYMEENFPLAPECDSGREVRIGGRYRHFKESKIVKVIATGRHTERPTDVFVIYKCYDGRIWIRPIDMFLSEVDKEKYPDARQKYRFELIDS